MLIIPPPPNLRHDNDGDELSMKEIVITIFLVIQLLAACAGITAGSWYRPTPCDHPWSRIELLVPAYPAGVCVGQWFSRPLSAKVP